MQACITHVLHQVCCGVKPLTHSSKAFVGTAEGVGIDMDQTSTTAIPAAVRPPSALLALESTASASGSHAEAGNYKVACTLQHMGHITARDMINAALHGD